MNFLRIFKVCCFVLFAVVLCILLNMFSFGWLMVWPDTDRVFESWFSTRIDLFINLLCVVIMYCVLWQVACRKKVISRRVFWAITAVNLVICIPMIYFTFTLFLPPNSLSYTELATLRVIKEMICILIYFTVILCHINLAIYYSRYGTISKMISAIYERITPK